MKKNSGKKRRSSETEKIVFGITPDQQHLLMQFHREILTDQNLDRLKMPFQEIFDREATLLDILIMQKFCRSKAVEWGSLDLVDGIHDGIEVRQLGLVQRRLD